MTDKVGQEVSLTKKNYFEGAMTNLLSNGHKIVLRTTENYLLSLILCISMNLININNSFGYEFSRGKKLKTQRASKIIFSFTHSSRNIIIQISILLKDH